MYSNMSYEEMLYSYVDGELDPQLDQSLFNVLNANPELQAEMRGLLALRSAVREDTVPPPAGLGPKILDSAGLPQLISTPSPSAPFLSSFSRIILSPATNLAVGACLAFLALGFVSDSTILKVSKQSSGESVTNPSSRGSMNRSVENTVTEVPDGAKYSTNTSVLLQSEPTHDHLRNGASRVGSFVTRRSELLSSFSNSELRKLSVVLAERFAVESQAHSPVASAIAVSEFREGGIGSEEEKKMPEVETPTQTFASNTRLIDSEFLRNGIQSRGAASLQRHGIESMPSSVLDFRADDIGNLGLIVRMNSTPTMFQASTTIGSQRQSKLANTSAGILYQINDENAIGVEVGEEAFVQRFSADANTPNARTITQNPLLFWYGIQYQHQWSSIEDFFNCRPYTELFAGTTTGSFFLLRTGTGISYQPDHRVRFNLGVEASSLIFNFQNHMTSSEKLGWKMGVGVAF